MLDESTAFRPPEDTPTVIPGQHARLLQLSPGTVLGGRYRIVSRVGGGGMGEVYRADDLKLGQTVALKFLARHGDSVRLYEEVRIGRQVSHPNVCRLTTSPKSTGSSSSRWNSSMERIWLRCCVVSAACRWKKR